MYKRAPACTNGIYQSPQCLILSSQLSIEVKFVLSSEFLAHVQSDRDHAPSSAIITRSSRAVNAARSSAATTRLDLGLVVRARADEESGESGV